MTPAQHKVIKSSEDITSLCDSAVDAYYGASKQAKSKVFTWRGTRFRASWSVYCIYVNDMKGNPIAQRIW